jgi:hypothetical protein
MDDKGSIAMKGDDIDAALPGRPRVTGISVPQLAPEYETSVKWHNNLLSRVGAITSSTILVDIRTVQDVY